MLIRRIEIGIDFAIPIELTDDEDRAIHVLVCKIAERIQPGARVHLRLQTNVESIRSDVYPEGGLERSVDERLSSGARFSSKQPPRT